MQLKNPFQGCGTLLCGVALGNIDVHFGVVQVQLLYIGLFGYKVDASRHGSQITHLAFYACAFNYAACVDGNVFERQVIDLNFPFQQRQQPHAHCNLLPLGYGVFLLCEQEILYCKFQRERESHAAYVYFKIAVGSHSLRNLSCGILLYRRQVEQKQKNP